MVLREIVKQLDYRPQQEAACFQQDLVLRAWHGDLLSAGRGLVFHIFTVLHMMRSIISIWEIPSVCRRNCMRTEGAA